MLQTFIRIGSVITSLSSLVFLPKKTVYKYLPVSIFASLLVLIICALSIPYKFWTVKGNMTNRIFNDLGFVFGPFFAGTM